MPNVHIFQTIVVCYFFLLVKLNVFSSSVLGTGDNSKVIEQIWYEMRTKSLNQIAL